MSVNNKNFKFNSLYDEIDLQSEDGFMENQKSIPNPRWHYLINKYLNSVQYTFEKGNFTTKKVSTALNNIPELTSKRLIQITLLFLFFALVIFLASCQTNNPYRNRVGHAALPKMIPNPVFSKLSPNKLGASDKEREQLYIKRDQLNIKQRESGSSSGSIWADSRSPKNLATEFKPTRMGDVVTVNIPEDLQYKQDSNPQGNNATGQNPPQKVEPVKSLKFEVVGMEPGGDVFLRGIKSYTSENGEKRNIVVLAKIPRRNINNSELNARDLTEVAVNENINGAESDYSSMGWDMLVSKKVSAYTPDLSAQTAMLDSEKKEIETQKKALADQQKSLAEESERLKKDRKRLDTESARAKPGAAKP